MTSLLVVLAVGAGSYGFRVAPLLLRDRVAVSARLDHLIRQAGTAAITALVVSSCIHAGEQGAWLPVLAAVGVGSGDRGPARLDAADRGLRSRRLPPARHRHLPPGMTCDDGSVTRVEVQLLGGFSVSVDGEAVPAAGWSRRHAASLVKVLALASGHRLHREQVIDAVWPEDTLDQAAPKLHKAAHFARKATGRPEAVVLGSDTVSLFPGAELVVDVTRFEELARQALAGADPDVVQRGDRRLRGRAAAAGSLRGLGRAAS